MPTYIRDGGVWKEVSGGSFTGNADTADQVSTGTTTGTGTYYPTFVNSNNSTRQNEFLYTDAGITYNPSTDSLGVSGDLAISGSLSGVEDLNGGPLAGTRNHIINGDMRISQRGTSFTGINVNATVQTYVMDRWFVGGGTIDNVKRFRVDLVNDAPTEEFQYSLKLTVTTTNIDVPSNENILIQQRIEGYNVRDLIGKPFTLSFWVKSSLPGIYSINFRSNYIESQPDLTDSYVVNYTISTTNWEYKTITVNPGLLNGLAWNFENGIGLRVSFQLSAGTLCRTSTTDSWNSGEFMSSTSAINNFFSALNTFSVTGVQLEPGSVATPFERRSYGAELALCKRYAQWVPFNQQFYASIGNTVHETTMTWPVEMRTTPNAATLTADPNTTQFVVNNSSNYIGRLTPYGGSAILIAANAGSSYAVGYRSLLTAEL